MATQRQIKEAKFLLGQKIAELRQKRGFSQATLAETIAKSEHHIGNIEIGKYAPRIDTLLDIAERLNVKVKDLFTF